MYYNWATDSVLVTISSVGSYNGSYTTLVVSTAISSDFKAGGCVANLSRNIEIGRFNASRGINQVPYPALNINLSTIYKMCNISIIGIYVFYAYVYNSSTNIKNIVFRNGNHLIFTPDTYTISENFSNGILSFSVSGALNFQSLYQNDLTINNLLFIATSMYLAGTSVIINNSKFIGSNIISSGYLNLVKIQNSNITGCYAIFDPVDFKEAQVKNCTIDKCYTLTK